ncbi:MAG TPA: hypothetical protein VF600_06915 [Abditibacteriaceae bacterium]
MAFHAAFHAAFRAAPVAGTVRPPDALWLARSTHLREHLSQRAVCCTPLG